MIKMVTDLFARKPKQKQAPETPELQARDSFPERLLKAARTKSYARVELSPASEASIALYGPCTVVKVIYPGDMGPALYVYHVLVAPSDWILLPYGEIQRIARAIGVEVADFVKAVDRLCGVHS